MRARPLATAAAAALLLFGLAACEKPTPGVTVVSGTSTAHVEATTYCHEGQTAANQDCAQDLEQVGIVRVKAGDRVGIDVDKSLVEHGWILVDTDAKARSGLQDGHYFSYVPDFSKGPIIHLEIHSLDQLAENAQVTGVWRFELIQK
jgi:hypothetical protein